MEKLKKTLDSEKAQLSSQITEMKQKHGQQVSQNTYLQVLYGFFDHMGF